MSNILVAILLLTVTFMALPFPAVGVLVRGVMVVSLVPVLLHARTGFRRREAGWLLMLTVYLGGTLLSVICAEDAGEAGLDFLRQLFICSLSGALVIYLREARARETMVRCLMLLSGLYVLIISWLVVNNFGAVSFSLAGFKTFKTTVSQDNNLPFNAMSYTLVVSSIVGSAVLAGRRVLTILFVSAMAVLTLICGSLTTVFSFALGAATFFFFRKGKLRLWLSLLALVALLGGFYIARHVDAFTLNEVTVGRFSLWQAALNKIAERPVLGWGAQSWKINLAAYLPKYDAARFETLLDLEHGGFHNSYLALLADKGVVTFIPALLMLVYLVRQSLQLYRRRHLFAFFDRVVVERLPLFVLMIPFECLAEQTGLFGFANAAPDFLAFTVASLVVALSSEGEGLAAAAAAVASPAHEGGHAG